MYTNHLLDYRKSQEILKSRSYIGHYLTQMYLGIINILFNQEHLII